MASVTIAGGGVAALELVLALRSLEVDASIELVAPRPESDYKPLAVLEPYSAGKVPALDLGRFAAEHAATLRHDTLVAVDSEAGSFATGGGARLPYEILVVAAGARAVEGLPGAIVFRGHQDARQIGLLVEELASGSLGRVAFAVPDGQRWSLPAYELALLAAAALRARGASAELSVVTPEDEPLALFGPEASRAVADLLQEAGISLHAGDAPARVEPGALVTAGDERIDVDRVIALPRLLGPRLAGLPSDEEGFIPVDHACRVIGLEDVYAAGDVTSFPVKQGGLATQQADAAAEAIAARLGADVQPAPFRPVLRGMLVAGEGALPLHQGRAAEGERPTLFAASRKVVGRHLMPYLAGSSEDEPYADRGALKVEIDLAPLAPSGP